MKITVVTICLNAEKTIESTMQSVLNQTYSEIEYLIIDGESNDRTLGIIKSYMDDGRIRLVSEKDKGIYNAMNKAIDLATGDYIIFMNSGDVFCDNKVLEDMISHLHMDLVYGNLIKKTIYGNKLKRYSKKDRIMFRLLLSMVSHQTIFTKTEVMKQYKFDEQYKICADYDFIVRAKKNKCSIEYVDRTICIMDKIEGVSSQIENLDWMRSENDKSLREHYKIYYCIVKIPKGIVRYFKRLNEFRQKQLNVKK